MIKYNYKKPKYAKRSIIWKMPLEEFKSLVQNSSSIGQILQAFNLKNKGGNNNTVQRRIIEENIPSDHIKTGNRSNKGRKFHVQKNPIETLLVENSTAHRGSLKKRIIEENLIKYKCECCKNPGIWNNKKLSLQLDHKNGISNDNRIENLRFLCPNCHSQTDTFSGKNKCK